jgi:uncharacterized protein
MKTTPHRPESLDVQAFAQDQSSLSGTSPLARFDRLASEAVPGEAAPGGIGWQARGELRPVRTGPPEVWLHLSAQGAIDLQCQRCLEPVRCALEVQRWIQFVPGGEEAAQALDAQSEHDVLPLSRRLNLFELLEDELLLALPLIARHEVCSIPAEPGAADAAAPQAAIDTTIDSPDGPFAALADLRRRPPRH